MAGLVEQLLLILLLALFVLMCADVVVELLLTLPPLLLAVVLFSEWVGDNASVETAASCFRLSGLPATTELEAANA